MFEFIFPIFCFGVVVTAIVVKGLLLAFEENKLQTEPLFDEENRKILHAFGLSPEANDQPEPRASTSKRRGAL